MALLVFLLLVVAFLVRDHVQVRRENEAWARGLAEDRRRAALTDEQRAAEGLPSAFDEVTRAIVQYHTRHRIPLPRGPFPRDPSVS